MNLNLDSHLVFALMNGKIANAFVHALQLGFSASELPLTPSQWMILAHLEEESGITQGQLCAHLEEEKPFISRTLATMEEAHLVQRRVDDEDTRVKHVYLTPRGKAVKERAQMIALRTLRHCFRGIPIDHLRIAQDTMRRIYDNSNKHV